MNIWIYGADAAAPKSALEEDFAAKVALVIGNEEMGLRKLVREDPATSLVKIPGRASRNRFIYLNGLFFSGVGSVRNSAFPKSSGQRPPKT
jgi:tRNA(Leu) C34 or U34 (ribose-2'-O)-methylase TrmL